MPLSEHVYCVAVTFEMTEQVEQEIKFCFKLKHSSVETIQMIQKSTAMGNSWLAASSQQRALPCITSHVVVWQNIKSPRDSAPLQPRFGALWLLAFPKTEITFEREEISDYWWDSGKYDQAADGKSHKGFCSVLNSGRDPGRTMWGPMVPNLKGTEVSLSNVQCFLYLIQ